MRWVRISDDRGRRVPLCRLQDLEPEIDPAVREAAGASNIRMWHVVPSLVAVAIVVVGVRAWRRSGGGSQALVTDVLRQGSRR